MERYTLHNGDSLDVLKQYPENHFDACVTDPPYGLSFMNKGWDYDVPKVDIWKEVYRVLKPGAHLLAFFGTRTYHRGAVNVEDAGFEVRDMLQWLYGQGFPKSHKLGDGWGTALKPANEPLVMARKPFKGSCRANHEKWSVGGLNIDACRVEDRWPANVMTDGSDEVISQFPHSRSGKLTAAQQANGGFKGTINCYGTADRGGETEYEASEGSASRFFWSPKTSKLDREEGLDDFEPKFTAASEFRPNHMEKTLAGENGNPYGRFDPRKNNHPTVKPTELMAYLCRLVTPKEGLVLDPFMGSGSTGKACMREGFRFVGIDLDEHYVEIAKARIEYECSKQESTLKGLWT